MKILILTGLTYYDRAYSLSGIIKTQAKMLKQYGHEVGIVVARGMANKEHLADFTLHECIESNDHDKTLQNIIPLLQEYDVFFTHDYAWVSYMEWLDLVSDKLEDLTDKKFYHFVHSAPGAENCPDWQKGRTKPNVFYCYPNECDRERFAKHIQVPLDHVLTIRLSNDFIDKMGGDEDLYEKLGLMDADYVGFYPAHLMPGKKAPEILMCVKAMVRNGMNVKYMFTANSMESGEAKTRLDSYKQMAKDFGIEKNIIWLTDYIGPVTPYETVQKLWNITNLFIMPSDSETTSLVLLEAMAHRCLIVGNESMPLCKEILGNGCIYHKFGTHLDRGSNMDDATLDKLCTLVKTWFQNHNALYVLDRAKRMYSRKHIYETYYQPLFKQPKISIIIPIMNTCDELVNFTKKTIETVRDYDNVELILVNNHKDDQTDYGADKVITNQENVGVSRAWNQGMSQATGEYIMILNSDIELPHGWANAMMQDGMVFPHANQDQGPIEHFAFPWVRGCCFMARKDVFNRIGPFDERFFAYYEDADYWKRCDINGIKPVRANIVIKHAVNATSGKLANLGVIIAESEKKFKEKYGLV